MIEWIEKHQLPCFYEQVLHIECPVCGFQRAFIQLLKGNWMESIQLYPALIPSLILLILLFSFLFFRKPGWNFVKRFLQFDLAVIMISYIGRFFF